MDDGLGWAAGPGEDPLGQLTRQMEWDRRDRGSAQRPQATGGGPGTRTHLAGRVMMRVEKSKRSRLILRKFRTSSSSSVTRIRSWSWPPSTLWGGAGAQTGRDLDMGTKEGFLLPNKQTLPTSLRMLPSRPGPCPLPLLYGPIYQPRPPLPQTHPSLLAPPTFSIVLHITACSWSNRSK